MNKFLDKVVEFLLKDTEISNEEGDKSFSPPFTSIWYSPDYLPHQYDRMLKHGFFYYCKNTYGLTDEETKIVWDEYKRNILNKFKNSGSISESSDKQNKFLDKVVELLVRGTILDYVNKTWTSPYIKPLFKYSYPSFDFILYTFHPFSNYCEDNYNLTEDEIFYVWRRYKEIILDKMNNSGSINESSDRKYL